jgi:hypothetical protein
VCARSTTPSGTTCACPTEPATLHATPPGSGNCPAAIAGIDPEPANAGLIRQWCVDYWSDLHPYSLGGAYINFLGEEEGADRVRGTYREHYDRLAAIKHTYDPDNFFHANQNIPPATS